MKVVIIGGVAGGASAAARLRRLDEHAEIILLERGPYISYANCGLPYYVGGEITQKSALTLQTPESFHQRFAVDVRVGHEAVRIDRQARTVEVRPQEGAAYTEPYDKLILAPGAEPVRPPIEGVNDERVFTLRTIPDTLKIKEFLEQRQPRRAMVVGGGFIGVEMAENLVLAGLEEVTLVELMDHIVGPLDIDMACDVHRYVATRGVRLRLNEGVRAIRSAGDSLEVETDGGKTVVDLVIMAVGTRPDTRLAKEAGLSLNAKGAIEVDGHMRTSDEHIYAVGDAVETTDFVTGRPANVPLAGPANKQGRIAADNICGLNSVFHGAQGSAVVKLFDMTAAMTGLNERAAKAAGIDYDKVFTFSPSHATYYPGSTNMSLKVLFERTTGLIIGAQIVGFDGVDKRLDVLATAIRAKMTGQDLAELELCYAPPYSSAKDPVNMAGFIIENLMGGKLNQYHWHDVASLPRDGSVTLLDVRKDEEYANGHIDGTVHIPLDSLRQRMGELDKSKPLYVNCQSGLRSYIACRMLMQNGFTCHNLAGGWRLYDAVTGQSGFNGDACHPCGEKIK